MASLNYFSDRSLGPEVAERAIALWDVCSDGARPPGPARLTHLGTSGNAVYRVDPGRSREMGGTGLGLSIVKHLVIAMHGEVYVTDNPTGGAIFRVTLPAAPVRDAMGGADDQTNGLASASAP